MSVCSECGHDKFKHCRDGCLVLLGEGMDTDFCPCLKSEEEVF